ncbi:MAG TPA: ankyrin repeat domain-containing protein [Candidatus Ozemobacteraceae bacterium]|nr:ankyrin repeat domain-containing protein [Candidatus Ozemobacteraceae bacterium]
MWTKLTQAIERCDIEAVRLFLSQEPEAVTLRNYQDETLLHFAAGVGSLEIVEELLKLGAQADLPDEFGWTPLHEACAHGHTNIVARFIDVHSNLEGISKKHETALHLAARSGFEEIVKLLLDAGANREVRNVHGETPLHVATADGNRAIMQLLLDARADVNARNFAGETPLHLAARDGDVDAAELCLSFRANPREEDKRGNNFLETAVRAGKRLFIEHFAGLGLKDPETETQVTDADGGIRKTTVIPAIQHDEEPHPQGSGPHQLRPSIIMKVKDVVADVMNPRRGLVNAFILGTPKPGAWLLFEMLDAVLWFIVFPMLIFIIWMGFHQNIIPGLVTLSGAGQADSIVLLLQTALNTLIVFGATSLLVETDKASPPLHHYMHHLRDNVRIRVVQFVIIDAFIIQRIAFGQLFWDTFFPFWAGFMMLYCASFMCWWIDTGGKVHVPKQRRAEMNRSA